MVSLKIPSWKATSLGDGDMLRWVRYQRALLIGPKDRVLAVPMISLFQCRDLWTTRRKIRELKSQGRPKYCLGNLSACLY